MGDYSTEGTETSGGLQNSLSMLVDQEGTHASCSDF